MTVPLSTACRSSAPLSLLLLFWRRLLNFASRRFFLNLMIFFLCTFFFCLIRQLVLSHCCYFLLYFIHFLFQKLVSFIKTVSITFLNNFCFASSENRFSLSFSVLPSSLSFLLFFQKEKLRGARISNFQTTKTH